MKWERLVQDVATNVIAIILFFCNSGEFLADINPNKGLKIKYNSVSFISPDKAM
jgi:hypothetical protein